MIKILDIWTKSQTFSPAALARVQGIIDQTALTGTANTAATGTSTGVFSANNGMQSTTPPGSPPAKVVGGTNGVGAMNGPAGGASGGTGDYPVRLPSCFFSRFCFALGSGSTSRSKRVLGRSEMLSEFGLRLIGMGLDHSEQKRRTSVARTMTRSPGQLERQQATDQGREEQTQTRIRARSRMNDASAVVFASFVVNCTGAGAGICIRRKKINEGIVYSVATIASDIHSDLSLRPHDLSFSLSAL